MAYIGSLSGVDYAWDLFSPSRIDSELKYWTTFADENWLWPKDWAEDIFSIILGFLSQVNALMNIVLEI